MSSTHISEAFLQPTTADMAKKLGLTEEEFAKIEGYLGRKPNFTELSVYSVMWSEHCSYKNSIVWLKKLPKHNARVMAAAGDENAGLMDIGDGLAVCFKIESHNHPSAIEPYNGAATGVGGIHRDIFTMGARPIASLNSLRFGDMNNPKVKRLLKGVVRGIGDYGNAFGIPTVGGEIYFEDCYTVNPLVNAMSVGIVQHGKTASAKATGVGNPVFIVGSATGKDGIHGATFASADLGENSEEQLPAVQVGDPFQEKLLLEATLEALDTGAIVAMQDMGAAGIACSTSEMSAKGEVGMLLWLDKAPRRQENMVPFELLLSESQERMLIVAEKGKEHLLTAVFEKWELPCTQIGVVTEGTDIVYTWYGETVGRIPADSLVLGGGAPVYHREYKEPSYFAQIAAFDAAKVPVPQDMGEVLRKLLSHPNIASKRWVARQYDSMVGAATVTTNSPADAAVVYIKGTSKALAMTTDCNGRYVYSDPRKGCAHAVAEAARNLAATGALPLGVTNCLNFGNPYNPEVYYQFSHAILGMKDACEAFDTPVTGGNVSFYNQSPEGPVYPTPTIGMVGLLDDASRRMSLNFKAPGHLIYLLGQHRNDINCSQYLASWHGVQYSPAPHLDLAEEKTLQAALLALSAKGLAQSAHDVSDGGLMVTLLESAFPSGLGFSIDLPTSIRPDALLFGEAGGRAVVSVRPEDEAAFLQLMVQHQQPVQRLGAVGGADAVVAGKVLSSVADAQQLYATALEKLL